MTRWQVHRAGDGWCAHKAPRGKPNHWFLSWREALAYALAWATIERAHEEGR